SPMELFTTSRLLMASGSQSNSSSSRCRPSACTLSLPPVVFSARKFFWQNFAHCGPYFLALQAKSGPPASFADAGAARRVPAAGADGHFLLAFLGRAVTMGENSRRPRARERLDEGGERSSGGP